MSRRPQEIAAAMLRRSFEELSELERGVVGRVADRRHVSRDVNREFEGQLTLGQRLADRMAAFGGSWVFIGCALAALFVWLGLNAIILRRVGKPFDPFPFILLNLVLSCLAALQAPVIMMSQNRQGVKDRMAAEHDYEVNLKAELEVMGLHEKLDGLREQQWAELIELQRRQLALLERIVAERGSDAGSREGA
jgi:uncharacterized membrane protein